MKSNKYSEAHFMDYSLQVVLLNLFLFIATFLSGFAPYFCKTRRSVMNLIAVLGAGMLMGACLVVIIPEGVMAMVTAFLNEEKKNEAAHNHAEEHEEHVVVLLHDHDHSKGYMRATWYIGVSLAFGFLLMLIIDQSFLIYKEYTVKKKEEKEINSHGSCSPRLRGDINEKLLEDYSDHISPGTKTQVMPRFNQMAVLDCEYAQNK
jgi:protein-S-isoprenylcysteine O-methyltransferase Ste14